MENAVELGPVLPRGICEECLQAFRARTLKTSDGGKVVGGLCPHNRTIAVLREYPDGTVSPWRLWTPADEQDLVEKMQRAAEVVRRLTTERRAGMN